MESAATGTGFNFARMRFGYPLKLLLGMVGVLLLLASLNLVTLLAARAEPGSGKPAFASRSAPAAAGSGPVSCGEHDTCLGRAAAGVLCATWASRFPGSIRVGR